jgi:serine/threonine protein kinase
MAPEQFLGKASYQSDIYSLGCIFYELITGRPPIFDPDPFKILEKAQQGKITPPRLRNSKIPREIDEIIMTCLASKVEDRYRKPAELIHALGALRKRDEKLPEIADMMSRIRARDQSKKELCWNCRRPLPLKSRTCPHCGETA